MKIGIVASEAIPFSKTGGLADVTGALFKEYTTLGEETFLFLPYYKATRELIKDLREEGKLKIKIGDENKEGRILSKEFNKNCKVIFIEQDEYFDRDKLYGTGDGDYIDNAERFGFFDRAVIEAAKILNLELDILHLNDWQTGLIPIFIKETGLKPKTLFTIHNLAYQGNFPPTKLEELGIDRQYFKVDGLEFYGSMSFIKSGIVYSDYISTVSPTYAREILTEEYGERLDGILRVKKNRLKGIINGIDYEVWNPETDPRISKNYSLNSIEGKSENKARLGQELLLEIGRAPLLGFVGRLATQKGVDILVEALTKLLLEQDIKVVVLGTGERKFEENLLELQRKYPQSLKAVIGFDDALAHKIYASSDFFLMPSRYEPCGLGQLISMKYGTLPIARETGGLKDTVDNFNEFTQFGNGFLFYDYSADALLESIKKALGIYNNKEIFGMMRGIAMSCDFSWRRSARKYIELFKTMIEET